MRLNMGDQEYNIGKKYRQKGTLCGPNSRLVEEASVNSTKDSLDERRGEKRLKTLEKK
jgi:hypothetical protein